MKDRAVRFAKAFGYESAKRIPYILLVMGAVLIWQGYQNSRQSAQNSAQLKTVVEQLTKVVNNTNTLSTKANGLATQANDIGNKNTVHIDCVKDLFVDYINTGRKISKADSDRCSVTAVQPAGTQAKPTPDVQSGMPHKQPAPPQNRHSFITRLLELLKLR